MNSRQLAQKWPSPRYKSFEKGLRIAASNWYVRKGYPSHPRMAYCLKNWSDWRSNIILDEVSNYIEQFKDNCEKEGKPFPLHKYIHHGLSSQAMAFNLIGPLITRDDYEPIIQLLKRKNLQIAASIASASFEFEDRDVFNEDTGQPTSIDIVLKDQHESPRVFIESKLVEKGFGGCSVFSGGDCNGENPIHNKKQCYLHFIGRRYWDLMDKYGFSKILENEKQCSFVAYYQFYREVLFSLEKGGVFLLLSDERSPVFHCASDGLERGLLAFLLKNFPKEYLTKVGAISLQELVSVIKGSDKHKDWIFEFESKYGMA